MRTYMMVKTCFIECQHLALKLEIPLSIYKTRSLAANLGK